MKRIIISLAVVGAVAAAVVVGTTAFFSDTETSTGNTFTAGTIDIAVNGQNPWSQTGQYVFEDMKPSQVEYSNFTINNVGTNPVNVWKKVDVGTTSGGVTSEPECLEQNGTWGGQVCTGNVEKSDIDTVITYDLSVVLKDSAGVPKWNQTLYNMNKTIAEIKGQGTFLGMIPEGWSMDVTESYHMLDTTTNWAQGDVMPFSITVTGEQLKGTAVLEDKDQVAPWRVLGGNGIDGTLTYGVKDSKFNFSFAGVAPVGGVSYSLVTYPEAFSTPSGPGWPGPVTVLATAVSVAGGAINIPSTSLELGTIKNMKVWLVKSGDLTGNNFNSWHPNDYLFDTGLIDYYDADL